MTFQYDMLPEMDIKRERIDGNRYYVMDGEYHYFPSVTEVLNCRGKKGLMQWRNRVGSQQANKVARKASSDGNTYHKMVEWYLQNQDPQFIVESLKPYPQTEKRFKEIQPHIDRISTIYGIELPVVSKALGVGGTVDCVADFDGKKSVIDHKTSAKPKKREWILKYFAQATAYSVALYEIYGFVTEQIVIIMSVEDQEDHVFIEKPQDHIGFLKESIGMYHRGEYD